MDTHTGTKRHRSDKEQTSDGDFGSKRKRDECHRRDPELYHSDGNIVIAAVDQADENTVYFKVHQTILSKYSMVFSDMFSLPQAVDLESYDGAPVVVLPDDAKDVRAFLTAIYDPFYLVSCRGNADVAFLFLELLQLANKYQADSLRAHMIQILEYAWPERLSAHDRREGFSEPGAAIRLGHSCAVPSILPLAYYELMRCSPLGDFDHLDPVSQRYITSAARWSLITREDLLRLAQGAKRIEVWWRDIEWDEALDSCCSAKCDLLKGQVALMSQDLSYNGGDYFRMLDPAFKDDEKHTIRDVLDTVQLCSQCHLGLVDQVDDIRHQLFDRLPSFFGLDPKT